jgi:hypothetical protein
MAKLSGIGKEVGFQRVWNFVVPLHSLTNHGSLQAIPPLNKKFSSKSRKTKTKKKIKH